MSTSPSATRRRATCSTRAIIRTPMRSSWFSARRSIRAVHRWSGLLRAVVATASNDHRLGANEAPPAIISVFLGEQLTDIFDQVTKGGAKSSKGKETLMVGVDSLPTLPKDAGDRNRTSPFAFTGNRFEFRAVGSGQSIAGPLVAMNTILAESLDYIATRLEKASRGDGTDFNAAVQKVLEDIIKEHGSIVFNGDGYTEAWHKEAEKRGLPNLRSCVEAIPVLGSKEATELFEHYGVLSERELHSRMDVYLEQYCLSVGLEARTAIEMAKTIIFPGGDPLSGRTGVDLRESEGGRLHLRYRHAGQNHRAGEGPAGRYREAGEGARVAWAEDASSSMRRIFATRCSPRWRRCARPPTSSKGWLLTICGRWRPIRRCCSSSRFCRGEMKRGAEAIAPRLFAPYVRVGRSPCWRHSLRR